ncbi:dipeptidase PepE [Saccharopolyspora phatthalungensis]|uniref:dipeptidase E n=1 Tax=Saccharopolyspora phatthalungensis TaxID=664693 RepID=A0A840QB55_9PSEU|nr:dipeptidase PepE [Saccharopolyspora phatthalungensis]MBB5155878.1 dipeptidase E [Saccharopolyspora phatthalungensis]
MELLLLSSSMKHGTGFLEHAMPAVAELLAGRRRLLFVPFAKHDHDLYAAIVQAAVAPLGITVEAIQRADDPVAAVRAAEGVFIGGGNTFRLLATLHRLGLLQALREAVRGGMPYLGASAGSNMACPSLRTSNDMPIVEPPSFEAIGLVPFQINPHYQDPDPGSMHQGETREQRIVEFLEDNDVPVLGIREGAWLRVRGYHAELGGSTGARLFTRGAQPRELQPGDDLTFLLNREPHFDS